MLLLAQSRNVDMKEVLTYSLGPFPLSLSTEMGTLHKAQKSKLMTSIESSVQNHTVDNVPEGNAIILDGMALIQATKKLQTFIVWRICREFVFEGDTVGNLSQIFACRCCGRYPDVRALKTSNGTFKQVVD
jgi:hypothetical protein